MHRGHSFQWHHLLQSTNRHDLAINDQSLYLINPTCNISQWIWIMHNYYPEVTSNKHFNKPTYLHTMHIAIISCATQLWSNNWKMPNLKVNSDFQCIKYRNYDHWIRTVTETMCNMSKWILYVVNPKTVFFITSSSRIWAYE